MKLLRTIQCKKCPWKVSTNPFDIPDGYDVEKHKSLACTIANPGDIRGSGNKVMACHHSYEGREQHCVGWIYNQLGPGNNIALRIQMMRCENIKDLKVIGRQHERFEDTLPY